VCIVTAESARDILRGNRALLIEYAGMGGAAGIGFGLAIGLFYLQRSGLSQQLRRALRKDALQVVYQPILELPSRNCAGAEALARWSDEDGNPVSPEIFVRIAEERGFVGELTSFVLRRAMHDVGDILRRHPELTLSINIAAADLEGNRLFALLDKYVRQAGIEPHQIALELTERSTANLAVLRDAVLRLHHEGYRVHIDDFGTGFSSLAYLHELAVDAIKIDRAFTRTIGTDAVTASILPQILALAESMQVDVIVEGVETEEQAEYLIATGKAMQAQGWYFGKPVVATELPKYREQMTVQNAIL
jgi:sensor c-di-GMP phosphodiesterase-like protein